MQGIYGEIYNIESFEQFEKAFSIGVNGTVNVKAYDFLGGGLTVAYMGQNSKNESIVAMSYSFGIGAGYFAGPVVNINTSRL